MKKLDAKTASVTILACAATLSLVACGGEGPSDPGLADTTACSVSTSEHQATMECPDSVFATPDTTEDTGEAGMTTMALSTTCPAKTQDNIFYCWCLYSWRGGWCSYHDCAC